MEERFRFLVCRSAGIQYRAATCTGILRRFHHSIGESVIHNANNKFVTIRGHGYFLPTWERLSLKKLNTDLPITLAIGIV